MKNKTVFSLLLLMGLTMPVVAEELQSDWIEPVPGFAEQILGTEIRAVGEADDNGETRVTVAVPKKLLIDAPEIQEIVVTAKARNQKVTLPAIRHEWVKDYDTDYYGLVLYLGKDQNVPFRLYFNIEEKP